MQTEPHPDHVDSDQHINGVIAWDALEHSIGGIIASFSRDILWEGHFVHTEGTLEQGMRWGCQAAVTWTGPTSQQQRHVLSRGLET